MRTFSEKYWLVIVTSNSGALMYRWEVTKVNMLHEARSCFVRVKYS